MTVKVKAVFDGAVFRPLEPVGLAPDTQCEMTIEAASPPAGPRNGADEEYVLSAIAAMAIDMGVTDLADRHHEYAHPVVAEE